MTNIASRIHREPPRIIGSIALTPSELDIFHEAYSPLDYLEATDVYIEDRNTLIFEVTSEENYDAIVAKLEALLGEL